MILFIQYVSIPRNRIVFTTPKIFSLLKKKMRLDYSFWTLGYFEYLRSLIFTLAYLWLNVLNQHDPCKETLGKKEFLIEGRVMLAWEIKLSFGILYLWGSSASWYFIIFIYGIIIVLSSKFCNAKSFLAWRLLFEIQK